MTEAPGNRYIPGDEVVINLGEFEHRQHLTQLRAVYANESDTTNVIEVFGNPEPAERPASMGGPVEGVFTSRASLSADIEGDRLPGTYWFQHIEADTYADNRVEFERRGERMEQLLIPDRIEVEPEPTSRPRLL